MDWLGLGIMLLRIAVMLLIVLQILPLLIWLERKASAYMQDRRGPAYANIGPVRLFGLIHAMADVVKLANKEDITPARAHRLFHLIAPAVSMFVALMTFAVIPFAGAIEIGGRVFPMQAAQLSVGILYILAVASLGVYGIILGAWASNNKYAMFGGLRSSSQIISYELVMTLSLVAVLMVYGSLRLDEIVPHQGASLAGWGVALQPLAAVLFIVCAFAETNRTPFDLPEGESEIVGFHLEYSSLRFALFFMAEYAHIVVAAGVTTSLFFGGYQIPFVPTDLLRGNASELLRILLFATALGGGLLGLLFLYFFFQGTERAPRDWDAGLLSVLVGFGPAAAALAVLALAGFSFDLGPTGSSILVSLLQFACFMVKTLFFAFCFIWVRWTLPRFRYDQLMRLGWKYMLPLALANIVITALVLYAKEA